MDTFETAVLIGQQLLRDPADPGRVPTAEEIAREAQTVAGMLNNRNPSAPIDAARLQRELESRFSIWVGSVATLDDLRNHVEWLSTARSDIDWRFWRRYEVFLAQDKGWPPGVLGRLDQTTDEVLSRLESPARAGKWDRRGLVVGQVQAGKTSHYTGLICKAADAGYRVIVVLAGATNDLRAQTQLRLDEGFLGFDSRVTRKFDTSTPRVGVGTIPVALGKIPIAHTGTNSEERGDFSAKVAQNFGIQPGGADPIVLVVKKNKSVLENLRDWSRAFQSVHDPERGHAIQKGVPLLLIDDEADYGSINTRAPTSGSDDGETEPTAINRVIREILNSFEQSAYVGYTATPFANIFIFPGTDHQRYGEDLFPRDFVVQLPSPSNYFGAPTLFGQDADQEVGLAHSEGLPLVRPVPDSDEWLPRRHKKHQAVQGLPTSLHEALLSFILGIAIRRARGQENVHNTMLVHVTRFVDVQAQVAELLTDEVSRVRKRLRYGENNRDSILKKIQTLWESSYLPTSKELMRARPDLCTDLTEVSWDDISEQLEPAISRIEVLKVNGSAGDALAYRDSPHGLYAIAVGGDKLSRGLTLEGLSVSYYLRHSTLYDTLMQMGRWFGYRPGYLDVCRIYTTPDLIAAYRHLSLVEQELQRDFQEMADARRSPMDFGLKVRSHPGGLAISGSGKLRGGVDMAVSYAGSLSESIIFSRHLADRRDNLNALDLLIAKAPQPATEDDVSGNYLWRGIAGQDIADFLRSLRVPTAATKAVPSILARYIRAQIPTGELCNWTLVVISNTSASPDDQYTLASGLTIGLTKRTDRTSDEERYTIGRLLNPPDEYLDLQPVEIERALKLTQEWHSAHPEKSRYKAEPTAPSGPFVRTVRAAEKGLLLVYLLHDGVTEAKPPAVGFGVSFPASETAKAVQYKVNEVYQEELFGDA